MNKRRSKFIILSVLSLSILFFVIALSTKVYAECGDYGSISEPAYEACIRRIGIVDNAFCKDQVCTGDIVGHEQDYAKYYASLSGTAILGFCQDAGKTGDCSHIHARSEIGLVDCTRECTSEIYESQQVCDSECVGVEDCDTSSCIEKEGNKIGCKFLDGKSCINQYENDKPGICQKGICVIQDFVTCQGEMPIGNEIFIGQSTYSISNPPPITSWNYIASGIPGACQWTCHNGFVKSGNRCIIDSGLDSCSGTMPIGNGILLGSQTYSIGLPPAITSWNYIASGTPGACQWTCTANYVRSGNTCVEEICIPDFSCNGRECGSNGCDSCGNCVSSDGKSIGVCDDKLGICYLQSCGFSSYKIDRPTETCDVTQVGRYQFFPESFELACKRNTGYFGVLKKCDPYKCSVPSNVCEYSTSLGLNSYLDFVENVCYNGITKIKGVCKDKKEPNCNGGVGGALYKDVIYYSPSVVDNNHYKDKREIYFAQSKKFDKSQGDGNAYVSDELIDYFVREVVLRITGVDGAYNFHEKFGFLPQDLFDDILFSNCAYRGIWIGDGCDGSAPNDISMYSVCPKIKDKQGTEYSICAFDLSGSPSFSFEKQNPRCTAVLRTDGFKNTEKLTFYNEYCSEGSASKKYVDWFGVSDGTICGEKNGKALFCDAGNCVEFKSTCQNNELDNGELCDYDGSGKALFISPLNIDNSCANNPSLNKGESPWVSGDIGCIKETCGLDFSKCNSQADLCGDGIKQDFEECDGSDFGNLKNCEDLDKKFGSGNLLCKTDCTIDKNACVEKPKNETLFCSDGINNDDYFDNASDCLDGNISTCTDCQDRDCNKIGYCEFQIEISCMDGIDNDQDGKIDEEDSDCIELFDWNNNKGYCSIYYNDDNQKKACYIKTGHECVKNGNKRGDFICNDGEWVSTKLLAVNDLLLNFPNAPNDYYILHCGNPKEVFNRVNYNTQDFKNVDNMLTSCTDFACAYKNDKNDSAILLAISAQCKPTENSWAYKDFFPSYIFTKTPPESDWFNTSGYEKIPPLQGYNLFLNGDSNFLVYSNKELFNPSLNTQLASSAMNGFSIISNNDFKNSKSFDSFFIYQMASAKSMGKRLNVNASFYAGVVFQGMDITTICETLKAKYQDNSLCISSQNAGYIFSTSSDSNQEIYKKHWPEYSLMVFNSFFT